MFCSLSRFYKCDLDCKSGQTILEHTGDEITSGCFFVVFFPCTTPDNLDHKPCCMHSLSVKMLHCVYAWINRELYRLQKCMKDSSFNICIQTHMSFVHHCLKKLLSKSLFFLPLVLCWMKPAVPSRFFIRYHINFSKTCKSTLPLHNSWSPSDKIPFHVGNAH